jgi:glycosyltransferase involved in cell wall biosynthesis
VPQEFRPVTIIPAYQAGETVRAVVEGVRRHVSEVVVVDDGSTDRTGEEAAAAGARVVRLPKNAGKGAAIRAGLGEVLPAGFTHVAFVDADGQHDPEDLPALLEAARGGEDFVIGSRVEGSEDIPRVRFRTSRTDSPASG